MSDRPGEKSKTNIKLINLTTLMAIITIFSLLIAILAIITPLLLEKVKSNDSGDVTEIVTDVNAGDELSDETQTDVEETRLYTQEEVNEIIETTSLAAAAAAREEVKTEFRTSYESGNTLMNSLRAMYPEYVIFISGSRYTFYEILDSIPSLSISQEHLKRNDNGEMEYIVNDEVISHKGIDVSRFQGKIDWAKVKEDGIEYAIIRAGIRGYGTGAIVMDENFDTNIKGALQNEIEVGVYFYTQAITEEEAIEEADAVIKALAPYNITYPVVLDIEDPNDSEARTASLTQEERTNIAIAFLDRIEEAGYQTMLYGNLYTYCQMVDLERLKDYDRWFAFYDDYIYFPYDVKMWQYTESGKVNGINGDVDLNIMFE